MPDVPATIDELREHLGLGYDALYRPFRPRAAKTDGRNHVVTLSGAVATSGEPGRSHRAA